MSPRQLGGGGLICTGLVVCCVSSLRAHATEGQAGRLLPPAEAGQVAGGYEEADPLYGEKLVLESGS